MVTFHPKVEQWRGHSKKLSNNPSPTSSTPESKSHPLDTSTPESPTLESAPPSHTTEAKVPAVRVNLVHSVHLLPHQSQVVEVSLNCQGDLKQPLLLDGSQLSCGVRVDTSLIDIDRDGRALTVLSNSTGCSVTVDEGSLLGAAVPVEPVEPVEPEPRGLRQTGFSSRSGQTSAVEPTTLTTLSASVSRLHSKPDT